MSLAAIGWIWIVLGAVLAANVWLGLRRGHVFGRAGRIDAASAPLRYRWTFGISLLGAPVLTLAGGLAAGGWIE